MLIRYSKTPQFHEPIIYLIVGSKYLEDLWLKTIIMKFTHQFLRKFVSDISIFLGSKAFRRFI